MKRVLFVVLTATAAIVTAACSTPADIRFDKEVYVLEGFDAEGQIVATAVDADGTPIKDGVDMTFFCQKNDIVKVTNDGKLKAVASGEDEVEVEIVGTEIKKIAKVRVKIPGSIAVSHEKLRLWVGQVKKNVAAWVLSEKEAYIEGYLPDWTSDDPTIVSVKRIPDPTRGQYQRSYVEMVGLKSGDTTVNATYGNLMTSITVRVYSEDDEVDLSGQRKPKDGEAPAEPEEAE